MRMEANKFAENSQPIFRTDVWGGESVQPVIACERPNWPIENASTVSERTRISPASFMLRRLAPLRLR